MARQRIAILFAPEDVRHRAVAAVALDEFVHAITPLHADSVIDPGTPVLLIWTRCAARHEDLARGLLGATDDVIVWRPDGAPAPTWLAHAYPVGPEMHARTLALMARLAMSEAERRHPAPPRARPPMARLALAGAMCAGVLLAAAGAAIGFAGRDSRAAVAEAAPIAGLRGLQ